MKLYLLPFTALFRVALCASMFLMGSSAFAHTVTGFTASKCFNTGNDAVIKAGITAVQNNTWYTWQYKDNSGTWKCFQSNGETGGNATVTINGKTFNVTGARTKGNVTSVTLTIKNATTDIDGLQVRVLMGDATNVPNCGSTTYEWGYNDIFKLRVRTQADCEGKGCDGNLLISGDNYYGGFEKGNLSDGSTELATGGTSSSTNRYKIVDNPKNYYSSFTDFEPYSGSYLFVARRVNSTTKKIWYRDITPSAAATGKIRTYSMCIWVTAVDGTEPNIRLLATSGAVTQQASASFTSSEIGKWKQLCVTIALPSTATAVSFAIYDQAATESNPNNMALDNMCLTFANLDDPTGPLPVKLANFGVTAEDNKNVSLNWATAEETNVNRFEVEHSVNGRVWNSIGSIVAKGESSVLTPYFLSHTSPANGENLYRLKMIDNDNSFEFSTVRSIIMKIVAGNAEVYPNPARDVIYLKGDAGVNSVQLYNLTGRIVNEQSGFPRSGINVSGLSSGVYIMKMSHADGTVTSRKLLIER